jgi:hypothetical protein
VQFSPRHRRYAIEIVVDRLSLLVAEVTPRRGDPKRRSRFTGRTERGLQSYTAVPATKWVGFGDVQRNALRGSAKLIR